MGDVIYHIVVLAVAAAGVCRGYRYGLTWQISGVLGLAFGSVCAHIFAIPADEAARSLFPSIAGHIGSEFAYSIISSAIVFCAVFLFFSLLTKVLRSAMQVFRVGILDSILGALFCMLKYLLFLSIVFNIGVSINPRSRLMKYANDNDGNLVEAVMWLAPAIIGSESFEDLHHDIQIFDARRISRNIAPVPGVVYVGDASRLASVLQTSPDNGV